MISVQLDDSFGCLRESQHMRSTRTACKARRPSRVHLRVSPPLPPRRLRAETTTASPQACKVWASSSPLQKRAHMTRVPVCTCKRKAWRTPPHPAHLQRTSLAATGWTCPRAPGAHQAPPAHLAPRSALPELLAVGQGRMRLPGQGTVPEPFLPGSLLVTEPV